MARGRVVRAPDDGTDFLRVRLENYSSRFAYDVPASNWAPVRLELPEVGNTCVVLFDDDGDAWVPMYGAG